MGYDRWGGGGRWHESRGIGRWGGRVRHETNTEGRRTASGVAVARLQGIGFTRGFYCFHAIAVCFFLIWTHQVESCHNVWLGMNIVVGVSNREFFMLSSNICSYR